MLYIVLAYLGGVLTILSPCILPIVPLVFSRADRPFVRSSLPLLVGMAVTFAVVASVAVAGGVWAAHVNQYGRWAALGLFGVFGLALLFPTFAERLMRPVVSAGNGLERIATHDRIQPGVMSSVILGIATGLLWAPCAGPILGLVLTGAALHGANGSTVGLLLGYAAGAATSLAVALMIGGRLLAAMKRTRNAGEKVRRGLGAAVLFAVAAIALGLDTSALAHVPNLSTDGVDAQLVKQLAPRSQAAQPAAEPAVKLAQATTSDAPASPSSIDPVSAAPELALPTEGLLPTLSGAAGWLNSSPLTAADLRGKVVVVNFWTYSCINCLRTLPYLKAWSKRYHDQGLVVVGVHAPEFAFEHSVGNVKRAASDLGIDYPIAIDNNLAVWQAFGNQYWPAIYVVDAQGRIRYHHFGEGDYDKSEQAIRQLLAEAGHPKLPTTMGETHAVGAQAAADPHDLGSPETYVGYQQAQGFVSKQAVLPDAVRAYTAPASIPLNSWSLNGAWKVGGERAQLTQASGKIVYRFHARDLHLVMGPGADGKPVRFRVTIDGVPPGVSHGADTAADGSGTVDKERLYQLVRQSGPVRDRTFTIEFLDPGVSAYAFTFG